MRKIRLALRLVGEGTSFSLRMWTMMEPIWRAVRLTKKRANGRLWPPYSRVRVRVGAAVGAEAGAEAGRRKRKELGTRRIRSIGAAMRSKGPVDVRDVCVLQLPC